MRTIILISLSCVILFSCASNKPTNSNNLTLGVVQSKIYKGQSQSKVLEILGSPNIATLSVLILLSNNYIFSNKFFYKFLCCFFLCCLKAPTIA